MGQMARGYISRSLLQLDIRPREVWSPNNNRSDLVGNGKTTLSYIQFHLLFYHISFIIFIIFNHLYFHFFFLMFVQNFKLLDRFYYIFLICMPISNFYSSLFLFFFFFSFWKYLTNEGVREKDFVFRRARPHLFGDQWVPSQYSWKHVPPWPGHSLHDPYFLTPALHCRVYFSFKQQKNANTSWKYINRKGRRKRAREVTLSTWNGAWNNK